MECLKPILVGKGYHTKRYVPCGKCAMCMANLRAEWCGRLMTEFYSSYESLFVTYTYDDDHIAETFNNNLIASVWKSHMQKYFKRLRKVLGKESIRYFLTAEYGSKTFRPHYHALLFFPRKLDITEKQLFDIITNTWSKGLVHFGKVEPASVAYTTKYCMKPSAIPTGGNNTFRLMSRFPPLGSSKDYSIEELGSFRLYGQTYKTSTLYRNKLKNALSDDLQRELKYQSDMAQLQRQQRHFARWCKQNGYNVDSIDSMIEYYKQKQIVKENQHMLHLKHIKEEKL